MSRHCQSIVTLQYFFGAHATSEKNRIATHANVTVSSARLLDFIKELQVYVYMLYASFVQKYVSKKERGASFGSFFSYVVNKQTKIIMNVGESTKL
jgi:hypothetical protein